MSENIDEYVCNLIAGKSLIAGLYSAVNRARNIRAFNNGVYCYKFYLPGIGSRVFKRGELLKLDNEALCRTIESVAAEIVNGRPTVRQAALMLLIVRIPIQKLYQAYNKALFMKSTIRKFCFTFCNPFYEISLVNRRCVTYNSQQLIDLFCHCSQDRFDTFFMWNNLPDNTLEESI